MTLLAGLHLPRAYVNGHDAEARHNMSIASLFGGLSARAGIEGSSMLDINNRLGRVGECYGAPRRDSKQFGELLEGH